MSAETDYEARYKLAEALARSPENVSAAAKAAGYRRQHVYRVMKDPEFAKMLDAAKRRLAESGGPIVSDDDGRAAKNYLLGVVEGREEGDQHRVAAAKALLSATTGSGKRPPVRHGAESEAEKVATEAPKPVDPVEVVKKWRTLPKMG